MTAIFDEIQFDPKISYGAIGGPSFRTTVISADSGAETRVGWWINGRSSWNISTGVKSRTQMTTLIAFFRARKGKLRGFRFKDWTDYTATRELFWNGVAAAPVRLVKTYSDGSGQTEVRTIWKPVLTTVQIYTAPSGGSPLTVGVDYTIDYTTGIITGLTGGGGHNYYWTGQYDVPVRFDTDEMQVNLEDFDIRQWDSIPIIELLLR